MLRISCNVFFLFVLGATANASPEAAAESKATAEIAALETEATAPENAVTSMKVLSFEQWKDAQTLDANNRLTRASNQLVFAKNKKSEKMELESLEKEVQRAQGSLTLTKEFTIEDYLVVYLMGPDMQKRQDTQAVLRAAAEMMSSEEVAELMRAWMKTLRSQTGNPTPPATSWIRPVNSKAWRTP